MNVKTELVAGALATATVTTPDGRTLRPYKRGGIALAAATLIGDKEHADNRATVQRYLGHIALTGIGEDRVEMARYARAAREIVRRQHGKVPEGISHTPDERGDDGRIIP